MSDSFSPTEIWTYDILPGLVEAEERRATAIAAAKERPGRTPRHNYGDRDQWKRVGDDPWGDLVNRDGYTPDGRQLFVKGTGA